jgi:UDP-N-acetylmuramoyl-tripeptide--D-alanyl-D-alanine ligase
MLISTLLVAALAVPAFYLAMRYNMHMLQLNGYVNTTHLRWLRGTFTHQWLLMVGFVLGLVRVLLPSVALDAVECVVLVLVILVYRAMKHLNTKILLAYTPRVRRMVATDLVICGLVVLLVGILAGLPSLSGAIMMLVSAQLPMCLLVNLVNHPMEAGINRHYINDAERRLAEVPGLKVLGVTGSYGKTSVKFYLQTLLQDHFNVLVTPESYNTPMGVVKTIRGELKPTDELFICEMGARCVGEIKEICDIVHPDWGVITSIGPQHLETFHTIENIKSTKFELGDALPAGGLLFLNGDNEYIQQKAPGYDNVVFYYAEGEGDGYRASDVSVSETGTEFTVTAPDGESERFRIRLIGAHNVINVVGAIAVANKLGIPLKELLVPARRLQPAEHRMQMRDHGQVTIIDDAYNSNPVGSKAAVETLALFHGMRILVTPGMVELGDEEKEYNRKFGTYAASCCDYVVLVGRTRAVPIREGLLAEGFPEEKCIVCDRLEEGLAYAYGIGTEEHKYILLENDLPDNY